MPRSHENTHVRNKAVDTERDQRKATTRHLNDQLRMLFAGGCIMITSGVKALPSDHRAMLLRSVCRFADFTTDNDPHDEHDFGAVEVAGIKVFWKIDCYDKQFEYGSSDPADPDVTSRVLTIMLAEEY